MTHWLPWLFELPFVPQSAKFQRLFNSRVRQRLLPAEPDHNSKIFWSHIVWSQMSGPKLSGL